MKMLNTDTSEEPESMSKIKAAIDAIKTVNIDNMTADDLKTTLTNLFTDMQSIPDSQDDLNNASEIDVDTMSESDMRDMLKSIQKRAISAPEHKQKPNLDDVFIKLESDMDAIKTADIANMSTDDVKTTLANLIMDMKDLRKPTGGYNNPTQVNLDSISESDMREMLQKIQYSANATASQNEASESTDLFTNLNEEIDNIKAADIDTLSLDELKELLIDLITDMKSIYTQTQVSSSESNEAFEINVDNMTESEMRELLKQIQEDDINQQMMDGLNLASMLTRIFSDNNDMNQFNSSTNVLSDEELVEA